MIKGVDTTVTTQTSSRLAALPLYKALLPISYNFLVADYWYSTATLSHKSLWHSSEVRT